MATILRQRSTLMAINKFSGNIGALSAVQRMSHSTLKRTALYDLHKELGGKMVGFAGYDMPVQYKDGIIKSHEHTRSKGCSSLFDVSHMGQLRIYGKDQVAFMEKVVVGDIVGLGEGQSRLSLITNDAGGIIDDCVITKYDDHLYVVVNAGNKDIDLKHMKTMLQQFGGDASIEYMEDRSLIALQGPGAANSLSRYVSFDLGKLQFMSGTHNKVAGIDCIITRCGYTGEDGFEISVPSSQAVKLAKVLLEDKSVLEAGLGARDSLRLEAGLCLHGHDISQDTTPIEGALGWTIRKDRRENGFPGSKIILDQLLNKTFTRKRVGFTVSGAPAREGSEIFTENGEKVGVVTSGTFSPTLKKAIGMAYINKGHFKIGTALKVKVRNKLQDLTVAKMPFVPPNYFKGS